MNEPAARPQPSGGPHESFAPGTYVLGGRYWIEGLIGQNAGSGSHVHRAVAVAGVPGAGLAQGDRVVIKVMPSADLKMAQDEYAFLRQAVDNWWDANVAQPVEVTLSGGGACIVTRYVSGDSLRGVLDRAPDGLEADRALRLAYSILNGLDVLHRVPRNKANHGVIHRDVKPENIIVTSPGTHDEKAVIIDLGIASTATKAFAAPLRATLPYASPEQLLSPGDVTVRSDLFAAAIVLYEMLCGARPFGRGVAQFVVGADGTAVEVPGLAGPAARSGEGAAVQQALRAVAWPVTELESDDGASSGSVSVPAGRERSATPVRERRPAAEDATKAASAMQEHEAVPATPPQGWHPVHVPAPTYTLAARAPRRALEELEETPYPSAPVPARPNSVRTLPTEGVEKEEIEFHPIDLDAVLEKRRAAGA